MNRPTVVIEEVLRRSEQGATRPFICRGDDDHLYFVKGWSAGYRSLICEWVAAQLASTFGLPVPDYRLAEVPEELVAPGGSPDLNDLGSGIVFASQNLPHVQEMNMSLRERISPDQAADVLVFDWWLHNEDRSLTGHGGNPNLLWDVEASQLVVIDHNLAFDRDFRMARFLETHVFASHWSRISTDLAEQARYLERMDGVLAGLEIIRASIPDLWWFIADDVATDLSWDEIDRCLGRCRQIDFWTTP